jgi:hypothetical protein
VDPSVADAFVARSALSGAGPPPVSTGHLSALG